ncbi:App1 family protein [Kineococcus sp. SYSU DK004]|uniref:App1 family protein n=1 Tax=Kineococcus sp. SYSU DK004 TaxID=3383125 RepID=UPI003D7DC82D
MITRGRRQADGRTGPEGREQAWRDFEQLREDALHDLGRLRGLDVAARPGEHGLHRAARVEEAVKGVVGSRLRRRGYHTRVVAYPGYGGPGWVRVLGRVLLGREAEEAERAAAERAAVRGWRNFLTVPVSDQEVRVRVGGQELRLSTDRGGYLDEVVAVDLPPGAHEVHLSVEDDDGPAGEGGVRSGEDGPSRSGTATITVVGPEPTIGLLSDIDDTVVVTRLPRPLIAAWNSFVLSEKARVPVNGMADLYRQVVAEYPGAPVLYLSTGAWNVAPTLTRFLRRSGYPTGPLLLTDWGPTNTGWFRDGSAHKRETLARLARELPQVTWLLVGDDGQHDPSLYAEFAAAAPERVAAVGIRRLTPAEKILAGGAPLQPTRAPEDTDVTWVTGDDGFELLHRWYRAGVLKLA